jgi:hypothetical protein
MNSSKNDLLPDPVRPDAYTPAEQTLRLIASLPAPPGLADRVQAGLHVAPRAGRIVMWRGPAGPAGGWMRNGVVRGAAAAAIVCVVAGGGWRVYSHVQQDGAAKILVMPAPVSPAGSPFSNAGARRVPETLQGPVLSHPVPASPEVNIVDKKPVERKAGPPVAPMKKKAGSRHAGAPVR